MKKNNLILLGIGLLLACLLAKAGGGVKPRAKAIPGCAALQATETVVVNGSFENLRQGSGGGTVGAFRAEDGTPLQTWVGPDCPANRLEVRTRVRIVGRPSSELFLVQDIQADKTLGESLSHQVHPRGKWAYLQRGGRIIRVLAKDVPNRMTVDVGTYGKRFTLE